MKLKLLQDIKGHQGHNALPVGRYLTHGIAPVIKGGGRYPVHLILREIRPGEKAAKGLAVLDDFVSQLTPVEGF